MPSKLICIFCFIGFFTFSHIKTYGAIAETYPAIAETYPAITDTALPSLTINEKVHIFAFALNLQCRVFRKIKYGKTCLEAQWLTEDSLFRDTKALKWEAEQLSLLMIDFILKDSLDVYKGVSNSFFLNDRKTFLNFYTDIPNEIVKQKDEMSIKDKIKIFLNCSLFKPAYKIDTVEHALYFLGTNSYKSFTDDYARFIFNYVLRNQPQYNTVVLGYRDEKKKLIALVYKLVELNGKMTIDHYAENDNAFPL